jgi:hypothetical protein
MKMALMSARSEEVKLPTGLQGLAGFSTLSRYSTSQEYAPEVLLATSSPRCV